MPAPPSPSTMIPDTESPPAAAPRGRRREWRRLLPFLPLVAALLYDFVQGTFAAGAKDIDTRYFFVAGKAWIRGLSPYDFDVYKAVWFEHFSDPIAPGVFAYLPGAIAYTLPLGLFGWPDAALVFRTINLLAVAVIAYLCLAALREHLSRPLTLRHVLPLAIGLSFGGVAGTLLTGQSSLIVCAATLALLTLPRQRSVLLGIAILVASSKPQLSFPAMVCAFAAERTKRTRFLELAGVAFAVSCCVLLVDRAPWTHIAQSLMGNASLGANSFERMIGLAPLLQAAGVAASASKVAAFVTFGVALVGVSLCARGSDRVDPKVAMLCFALAGIGYPVHGYDTSLLAPVCAFAALLGGRALAVLALPVLFLSRPGLVLRTLHLAALPPSELAQNTFAGLCWVSVAAILAVTVVRGVRSPQARA